MELRICHLYPDVLNLYGDRGNIACLCRRLAWRGVACTVTELPLGSHSSLGGFDLFFIGGGQDFEQQLLGEDLRAGKAAALRAAVEDGQTFLLICGGYQLLGRSYRMADGTECEYVGALDLVTVAGTRRMIGNAACRTPEAGVLVGFENHAGRTLLGASVRPLGQTLRGGGNNGGDGGEGARYKNVFGSYYHGSLLPKNPVFCDLLLRTALSRRYGTVELPALEDDAERAAHAALCARMHIRP